MIPITTGKNFKTLARMGYSARGVVYLVIGGLAVLAAVGAGGETTDSKGALVKIFNQPFGNFLLTMLIIGLCGYVLWRFVQAVKDTDSHGTSAKGLAIRSGLLASSITHAFLAVWALKLLMGDSTNETHSSSTKSFIATDTGHLVLGILGVAMIVAGLAHLYKGWTARFERYMSIPAGKSSWVRPLCQFGLMARGVVWCVLGWFFIKSAFMVNSGEIKGLADALAAIRDNSYGTWLFGIVAAGLFAFGIYSLLEAVYRRIDLPPSSL